MQAKRSLLEVAKRHWRLFLPAWLFPIFAMVSSSFAERAAHGELFFYVVLAPLFFWSFFRAVKPGFVYSEPYFKVVFWAMLAPFVIAVVAGISWSALRGALGGGA